MKKINVILKSPVLDATGVAYIDSSSNGKIAMTKLFLMADQFAAFTSANQEKLSPKDMYRAFYDSLSKEEQLLYRAYNVTVEKGSIHILRGKFFLVCTCKCSKLISH